MERYRSFKIKRVLKNKLFSLLIANYNNGQYIHNAINSIHCQTYSEWEIIIVDDCSTDDSLSIIQSFIDEGVRIRLFINPVNSGVAYTKKRCIDEASGDILGFLDPDDALMAHALSVMISAHEKQPDASLISSNFFICDSNMGRRRKMVTYLPDKGKSLLDMYNEKPSISHFASFKHSLYKETVGMNTDYKRAVDQDLYLLMEEVGELGHVDEFLYLYRVHNGGISLGKNYYKALASHIEIILDTCKRRGIDKEMYLGEFLERRDSSFNMTYIIKKKIKALIHRIGL